MQKPSRYIDGYSDEQTALLPGRDSQTWSIALCKLYAELGSTQGQLGRRNCGPVDRGEYRQAAGAIAKALTTRFHKVRNPKAGSPPARPKKIGAAN